MTEEIQESLTFIGETNPITLKDLENCPTEGGGVHQWIFRSAIRLMPFFNDHDIYDIVAHYVSIFRGNEIEVAIRNARAIYSGQRGASPPAPKAKVAFKIAHKIVMAAGPGIYGNWKSWSRVAVKEISAETAIDTCYPGNPLLCVGATCRIFRTDKREEFRGVEERFQFLVPNPMSAKKGRTRDGRLSEHTLDNTGPRIFLVLDFDMTPGGDWGPWIKKWKEAGISLLDAQTAIILALGNEGFPTLHPCIVLFSGGKSLHAWYYVAGLHEDQIFPFMRRAISLGADPRTWSRSQFVRMPGAMRDNGVRQEVLYLNPRVISTTP